MFDKSLLIGLKSRLSLRLLIYVLVCSLFFSLLASAFQLYISYRRDLETVQQNLQFILESHLPPLANSTFNLNIEQIQLQLKSLLQFKHIDYVEVTDAANRSALRISEGNSDGKKDLAETHSLAYQLPSGTKIVVGSLKIIASYAEVNDRLLGNASVILATTTVQIFLAALFILLIIQWLITRHMIAMARYVEQQDINLNSGPLTLNRTPLLFSKGDELDQVVNAFNDLRVRIIRELNDRRQIEIELRESEKKSKEAQEIAQLGYWELDLKTDNLTWSDEIFRIFELDPTKIEASYEAFLDRVHPGDRQMVDQTFGSSVRSRTPFNITHRLQFEDGRTKTIQNQSRTDYDHSGNTIRSLGTIQDITSQKEAEKELRLIQHSIENSSTGIFRIGKDGRFLYINQTACFMTGYTQQELYQMRVWDIEPDFSPEVFDALWQELKTKDSVTRPSRIKTKAGRLTPLEVIANLQEFEGEKYLFADATNITERIEKERALLDSQWKLNAIINNHFQFTGLLDLEGRLLVVNKTALDFVGVREQDVIGKYFWDTVWWNHSIDVQEQLKRSIASAKGGTTVSETTTHYDANGELRYIDYAVKQVTDDDGRMVYLLAEGRDFTEEKRIEVELKKYQEQLEELVKDRTLEANMAKEAAEEAQRVAETANRAKSAFLANMSHELRTPLNAIMGYSQLMQRDTTLKDRQRERLSNINRSGKHLLDLINDVLEMAKIESGYTEFLEKNVDLFDLLQILEKSFTLRAKEKGLKLMFSRSPEVPQYIFTDEGKLRQIMFNLISNAIKFTETGEVNVVINWDSNVTARSLLGFEVHDTGPGIQPEEMYKLFSAFEQTRSGREKEEGTGLGLAISQNFAHLMGGKISVESQVGVGSVFKLRIKTDLSEPEQSQDRTSNRRVKGLKSDQESQRILVVDDQEDNRRILTNLLETVGFIVKEAKNGREGIALCQSWQPHLIFMDMRMPEMDGYEATRMIKKQGGQNAPPVIAVTASAFEEEKSKVLATGCDDYIRKPILEENIFNSITEHLGVEFIYEEGRFSPDSSPVTSELVFLTAESLSSLPEDLLKELKIKSLELDQQAMKRLIQKIRAQGHLEIAQGLEILVTEFQFEKIHDLIK